MNKDFKFSIIFYLEDVVEESISSVINQDLTFNDNIQIILCCSNDKTKKFAFEYEKRYPDNIIVLTKDLLPESDYLDSEFRINQFRRFAISYCSGEYIGFLQSGDKYGLDTFKKVLNFFNIHDDIDLVSISILNLKNLKEKFAYQFMFNEKLIDLHNYDNSEHNYFYLPIYSTFIKKASLLNHIFESDIVDDDGLLVVSKILLNNPKFGYLNNVFYYFSKKIFNFNEYVSPISIEDKFKFFNNLIDYVNKNWGHIPEFIQFILIRELQKIVEIEDVSSFTNNKEDVDKFWSSFYNIFDCIDRNVIEENNLIRANVESFLVFLKNKDFHIVVAEDTLHIKSKDYIINELDMHFIWLDIVEIRNGFLNISGNFVSNCRLENLSFEAIKFTTNGDKEFFQGKFYDYCTSNRRTIKFLSIPWVFNYNFDFKIPIRDNENFKVKLRLIYHEDEEVVMLNNRIAFRKYSDLSSYSHYMIKNNKILIFTNNSFELTPFSYKKLLKIDIRSLIHIFFSRPGQTKNGLILRFIHLLLYPFMKKRNIWILSERIDQADDTAEHLFKYAVKQDDDVEVYFAIDKNCPDYKRLNEIDKHVLPYGSLKHKMYYLFAKKIIVSQPGISVYNPLYLENYRIFAGLCSAPVYFLQHGVIKDNMSSWLHKFDRNMALITTSADLETESFFKYPGYNYGRDVVQTLGLTRYDNLTNENLKKQILIMPSWRNYIADENDLLKSEYFKRWNDLINNKEFIELAKNKGYDILFKPHPNLYKFIDLFDENDYVIIDHEKKYQEIFNESALLITDYSSIFFDFSYLKKPIIYYQYAHDYHFDSENGYFQYDTMGFGDVIVKEVDLIEKIEYYLNNGCVMEDKFKKRVEGFFKYNDRNNCKRNYDWIYEH